MSTLMNATLLSSIDDSNDMSPNPLARLADVAASLRPYAVNDHVNSKLHSGSMKPETSPNSCVWTPAHTHNSSSNCDSHAININYSLPHHKQQQQQHSMLSLRFILQKPQVTSPWGITLSMIDTNFLIVGYLDRGLVHRFTLFASHEHLVEPPCQRDHQQRPAFEILRPGDIIQSINSRPIYSFGSFYNITEFLRNSTYLWITVIRATTLPHTITTNILPQHSHWVAEQTHYFLKPQLARIKRSPVIFPMNKPQIISQFAKPETKKPIDFAPVMFRNNMFHDMSGMPLPYDDDFEFDPDDGLRAKHFLVPVGCFRSWLDERKAKWRLYCWTVYKFNSDKNDKFGWNDDETENDSSTNVPYDFWLNQGFTSFEEWQRSRTAAWKRCYSWNRRKRKRIEEDAEEIVHFPTTDDSGYSLKDWLRVRKNQWKILRRKYQRKLEQTEQYTLLLNKIACFERSDCLLQECNANKSLLFSPQRVTTGDMLLIDALLEEKENQRKANLSTYNFDFVFDANLGAPDDVIAHCLHYLHPCEHGKLLCINSMTSSAFKERDDMWRQLCPRHWILPRRPRKRWFDLYLSKIRQEEDASRKRSDDLLLNVANVLFKGDQLQKVEKLVLVGEQKFSFSVNYVSGVVCERNSILNLAVIHGRHKVVRWLVETKGADVETSDRGGFTPLLNAAWSGDVKLVRFLMGHGCDRTKLGRGHYTKPLAAPDFNGYTAEGWARERSFPAIAELLRVGL